MIPHTQLEINIPNLTHNFHYFKSKLNDRTKVLVLVKANAYGHGLVPFARSMEKIGADYLAVATVNEGIKLKKNGIHLPVLVLTTGMEQFSDIIEYGLEPGIPNAESFKKFADEIRKKGLKSYPAHINIDTGMHRLGFKEKELYLLKGLLNDYPEVIIKSFYSHLAAVDESKHDEFTLGQISLFERLTTDLMSVLPYRPLRHILNSAGIERFPEYQYDMVRLGIGIYGISFVDRTILRPSSYYRCPIVQVNELAPSEGTVGYGRHGQLGPGIKKIATLPVGYADGINRHFGNGKVSFEVNGKMAPTIGNICMDMCMIDVTGIDVKEEDVVTIFGDNPTVSDLAKVLDTIPYEIFTSISSRVERVVKE